VSFWTVHGTRSLYESDTVRLELADVELTDGTRIDHHVIRIPFEIASVVVRDADDRVLLLRRHRFVVDRWCWDVPAGKVAAGETAEDAAVRAAVDETGWRPDAVSLLGRYHPSPGISDQGFAVCTADGAARVGEPDANEAEAVEWVPVERVRQLVSEGGVDGLSLTSLLWALPTPAQTSGRSTT
jgi:8-oxo-dGTP pyrophosphatase MutT (NUDIX family)